MPTELVAAVAILDERHDKLPQNPFDENSYTLRSVNKHNIVITCLPSGVTGTVAAAGVAEGMRSTFKFIRFSLMVGIEGSDAY